MYYVTNKITEGASVENIKMLQHPYTRQIKVLKS